MPPEQIPQLSIIADPDYGKLLREAVIKGVEILPCRFIVTPQEVNYLGIAEFIN